MTRYNERGRCADCDRRRILYPDPESSSAICGECTDKRKEQRRERGERIANDINKLTKPDLIEILKSIVLASGAEGKTIRASDELINNMRQLYDITIVRTTDERTSLRTFDITVSERPA